MGRPAATEKRREVCRNALEFLEKNGINTSTRALAEGIGLKRPTLLYYYPDRKELLEEALTDLLSEQVRFVVRRISTHSHPIDQLFEQVRSVHLFHHMRERRLLFLTQALVMAGSDNIDSFMQTGEQAFRSQREALVRRVEGAIEAGTVHPCDAQALVALTRATVDGFMVQRVMTQIDLKPIHRFLWETLYRPLKIFQPHESQAMPVCELQPERNLQ